MLITLSLLHPLKQIPVQVWTFADESLIRIGRSADNQVVLYSAVVSRHHAELRRTGASWEVINLGSNGTYMEGKRVTQMPLQNGAVIRLARSGPNIQFRMGKAALEEVAEPLPDLRLERSNAANMLPTEITAPASSQTPDSQTPDSQIPGASQDSPKA